MSNEIAQVEARLNTELRAAEVMAQADMLPDRFKGKPANVLVAREIAQAMGESPWVTMSELYFVGNVPTFSAKYMRSRARAAGHIVRTDYDAKTQTATCTIIRNDDPDYEHVVKWDMAKARAHGLGDKGHWKKNPELMLKNRAVSECVREACNEVLGGVNYTREEAEAMQPVRATARRADQPSVGDVRAQLTARTTTTEPDPEEVAEVDELSATLARIETAQDMDGLSAIMSNAKGLLTEEEYDTARQIANAKAGELNG